MKIGRHFFLLSSILLLFLLFPCFVEAMKCAAADGACHPYSEFIELYNKVDLGPQTTKECKNGTDACAVFWCLIDHQKVLTGYGCYSDYVSICGNVSNNAVINVTDLDAWLTQRELLNINARVYACINGENCAADKYNDLESSGLWGYYTNKFSQDADEKYDKSCKYGPGAPDASLSSSIGMKQINGFNFFGIMILIGFFIAQFW